jgi:hypothetical protein
MVTRPSRVVPAFGVACSTVGPPLRAEGQVRVGFVRCEGLQDDARERSWLDAEGFAAMGVET